MVGVLNTGLPNLLNAGAITEIKVSTLAAFNATAPMFSIVLLVISRRKVPSARSCIGLFLGLIGTIYVTTSTRSLPSPNEYFGILAALGAALSIGSAAVYLKLRGDQIGPDQTVAGSFLVSSIAMLPTAIICDVPVWPEPTVYIYILLLVVVCTIIPYWLYFRLLQEKEPEFALLVTYLIPGFGVLWSVTFLGESFSIQEAIGLSLILVGIVVTIDPAR